MEVTWQVAAIWIGMALVATLLSVRLGMSVALVEICVGIAGGNLLELHSTVWIDFLAAVGSVLLTFLAGAEIDLVVLRVRWKETISIGLASFLAPFLGAMAYAHWVAGWSLAASEIAGIALSTTSVAVVYAVMLERGYNATALGKVILAACFVTDLGTVLALGLIFARYDWWLLAFVLVMGVALWTLPPATAWFFAMVGPRISEPETKYILVILFALGALATTAQSEAVLPAYLVGMVLAPQFLANRTLAQRMRVIAFSLLTPFYFLKAGSLVGLRAVLASAGLIGIFLVVKMAAKFVGVWPLAHAFRFGRREATYTTLLMSTGLTFGTISALYGLSHELITQDQYAVLVTAVILSAIVPTLIAERWFDPGGAPQEEALDRRATERVPAVEPDKAHRPVHQS
ncbi:MAG TPA: cation:proton antiporter [Nitrospiraceae bacterium]|jgi:Kef-type K+ transport system membrane component KefB|nr:cation:proton antiporter [Nitrospiraceae bacterium]